MQKNENNLLKTKLNYIRLPDYFKLVTYKYLSEKSTSRAEQLNPDGNLSGNETKHKLNAIAAFLDIKYFLWLKHMVIHLFGLLFSSIIKK